MLCQQNIRYVQNANYGLVGASVSNDAILCTLIKQRVGTMNRIQNDKGEYVIAVGSPTSIMRIKCTYPALLEKLATLKRARNGTLSPLAIDEQLHTAEVPLWMFETFYEIVEDI